MIKEEEKANIKLVDNLLVHVVVLRIISVKKGSSIFIKNEAKDLDNFVSTVSDLYQNEQVLQSVCEA